MNYICHQLLKIPLIVQKNTCHLMRPYLSKILSSLNRPACQTKYFFSRFKISQQNYNQLLLKFSQKQALDCLSQYLIKENAIEILSIVKETKMPDNQKIVNLTILEKLCLKNDQQQQHNENTQGDRQNPQIKNDRQFNVLANIYSQKSRIYLETGNITQAIIDSQRAVQAIKSMDNPFYVEVAILCQSAGSLHLQMRSLQKAEKYFKQSQHNMNIAIQQYEQSKQSSEQMKKYGQNTDMANNLFFAKLYSQYVLLYFLKGNSTSAKHYLQSSLQRWSMLPNRNILTYLITVKYSCLMSIKNKETDQAIATAQSYLSNYSENSQTKFHRMWFLKLLSDHNKQQYQQQLRNKIDKLSKTVTKQQLQSILIRIGVISSQKKQKSKDKQ